MTKCFTISACGTAEAADISMGSTLVHLLCFVHRHVSRDADCRSIGQRSQTSVRHLIWPGGDGGLCNQKFNPVCTMHVILYQVACLSLNPILIVFCTHFGFIRCVISVCTIKHKMAHALTGAPDMFLNACAHIRLWRYKQGVRAYPFKLGGIPSLKGFSRVAKVRLRLAGAVALCLNN